MAVVWLNARNRTTVDCPWLDDGELVEPSRCWGWRRRHRAMNARHKPKSKKAERVSVFPVRLPLPRERRAPGQPWSTGGETTSPRRAGPGRLTPGFRRWRSPRANSGRTRWERPPAGSRRHRSQDQHALRPQPSQPRPSRHLHHRPVNRRIRVDTPDVGTGAVAGSVGAVAQAFCGKHADGRGHRPSAVPAGRVRAARPPQQAPPCRTSAGTAARRVGPGRSCHRTSARTRRWRR
jgi:hypothetical protein